MSSKESLELDVHSRNELNKLLIVELGNLLPQLLAFVGKKIFTLNGFAKNVVITFTGTKPVSFNKGFAQVYQCYLTEAYGKLELRFKLCFNGGSYDVSPSTAYTKYIEQSIQLGEMESGGILKNLRDINNLISDYNLTKVLSVKTELELIAEYKRLIDLADKAKRKITVNEEIYRYL